MTDTRINDLTNDIDELKRLYVALLDVNTENSNRAKQYLKANETLRDRQLQQKEIFISLVVTMFKEMAEMSSLLG